MNNLQLLSENWDFVAFSATAIIALARYLFVNIRDRRNLYGLFLEEVMINYEILAACMDNHLREEFDGGRESTLTVMSIRGMAQLVEFRFVETQYSNLQKISRNRLDKIFLINQDVKSILVNVKLWQELFHLDGSGTAAEIETRDFLAEQIIMFSQRVIKNSQEILEEDTKGREFLAHRAEVESSAELAVRCFKEMARKLEITPANQAVAPS